MARLANIHPGEIFLEEFLKLMKITAYRLSKRDNEYANSEIKRNYQRL